MTRELKKRIVTSVLLFSLFLENISSLYALPKVKFHKIHNMIYITTKKCIIINI